ncbi:MAG: VOC family protein [Saprospiraceae bacterium]|nr:VOC family protein [Saprospiraceae bacterium]
MARINSYLTFKGNCREAMTFYQNCLGGDLNFQTIGESPIADKMPPLMRESILHATLSKEGWILLASDMVADEGLIVGNAVSLMLDCDSEQEINHCYERLSSGGQKTHPLEFSFWGAFFGDLIDKYGNRWLLHYQNQNDQN